MKLREVYGDQFKTDISGKWMRVDIVDELVDQVIDQVLVEAQDELDFDNASLQLIKNRVYGST